MFRRAYRVAEGKRLGVRPWKQANIVEMFAEILEVCRIPTVKTQIMRKTNLSYPTLKNFITRLQELGLLRLGDGARKYVTTGKGLEFLRKYGELQNLLKG